LRSDMWLRTAPRKPAVKEADTSLPSSLSAH
jgi:hypothetical protein